jgi:hypothetical protein
MGEAERNPSKWLKVYLSAVGTTANHVLLAKKKSPLYWQ